MTQLIITIKGDHQTYINAAAIRAAGGIWDKETQTWAIGAEDLYNNMMYDGRRTIAGCYRFNLINKTDWDNFIAQKSEQTIIVPAAASADGKESKITEQSIMLAQKSEQFGAQRIETDLFDAMNGNKDATAKVLSGERLMTEAELKSFLTYAQ